MSNKYEFIAPCHFGLEAVCKREIADLGYEIVKVEDGKVTFAGDMDALVRANIFLRTTQRILLKVSEFKAVTFEELFQNVKKVPWEEYFPSDARFWVTKATSVKSKLFSPSDIQSIVKKAMVERMKEHYHINWFEEDGADYPVRVIIYKDIVTIGLDTSGESLHKRGYRRMVSKAPIEETLAAALIKLTPWNKSRILVDPFCGSGTFPIEAAMMGANIAPGMHREFQAQNWDNIVSPKLFARGFEEAESLVDTSVEMDIQGYDIDPQIVKAAPDALYIIVSNPVDIMTYVFTKISGLPENQIIGSGTILDTARLRCGLSEHFKVSQKNIHAYVFGEHGDTSFIPWTGAYISGVSINEYYELAKSLGKDVKELDKEAMLAYVQKSGGQIIAKKGATFYAVSKAVCKLCGIVLASSDSVATVSSMMHGEYGIEDVCLSTLTLVGPNGIQGKVPMRMNQKEIEQLKKSADALKEVIAQINLD